MFTKTFSFHFILTNSTFVKRGLQVQTKNISLYDYIIYEFMTLFKIISH